MRHCHETCRVGLAVSAPEMLDPKMRGVRGVDDGGAALEWMSVPAVREVAIQPATTDVFLQRASSARSERSVDAAVLSTRFIGCHILIQSLGG